MPRFFIGGGSNIAGGVAFIGGEDAAHAKVLRIRVGDRLIVCDGAGKDHHCTVTKVTDRQVEAEVFETVPCPGEPSVHVTVLAGLPKGDRADFIVQKCTEAGASEILFFPCHPVRSPAHGPVGEEGGPLAAHCGGGGQAIRPGIIPRVGVLEDLARHSTGQRHRFAPVHVRNGRTAQDVEGRAGKRGHDFLRRRHHRPGRGL